MLREINRTEKDKYRMLSLICGMQKPKQVDKHNKTETDSQIKSKLVVTRDKAWQAE